MPKAPLTFDHMIVLSETLEAFSRTGADTVKVAVCLELKNKIDKKVTGFIPVNGYKLKLTNPERELVKQLNQLYAFSKNANYSNSYLRLLQQNL